MPDFLRSLAVRLALPASLFLAGCGGVSISAAFFDEDNIIEQLPYAQLADTTNSAIAQRRFVLIRDLSSWSALWAEHTANRSPAPPLPAINFSQNMVAAVFVGSRSNGCYSVGIDSVWRRSDPDRIVVQYREASGPPGAICAAVITNPVAMIVLPYSSLPVEFIQVS